MGMIKKRSSMVRNFLAMLISVILFIGNGTAFAEKEKPGAILVVQKKDGETIKGELLDVKYGTLTMLVYENNCKMDFRLDEISKISKERTNAMGRGLLYGFLFGAGAGFTILGVGKLINVSNGETYGLEFFFSLNLYILLRCILPATLVGLAVGTAVDSANKKPIQLEGKTPEKLFQAEAKLKTMARFRMKLYSYWKFVFSGPSDETHVVIFTLARDSGKFEFHGVDGYAGTFSDDGKTISVALPGHPAIVFNGQFIDANNMAGTWENSGETWSWTAVRTSWTEAVKETPISESKLF